ncbi:MAG: glutamate synthase large chain [Chloroflexota bacterium]|nr:glutamate synthase large chain [Chloroflexota bacterium]
MIKPIPAAVQRDPRADEHDACALIANVRKKGGASHGNVKRTIEALMMMSHRSGIVDGEGDGCGVLVDIPRRIWAERLVKAGLFEAVTTHPRFFVGHFMVPRTIDQGAGRLRDRLEDIFKAAGVEILWSGPGEVHPFALGPAAKEEEPDFWQLAGFLNQGETSGVNARLFQLQLEIERDTEIHVASLSADSCVYKIRGSAETLTRYYPELRRPDFVSAITIGHNRYSTNTASAFERVQPFSMLAHNGEINTVARLREEALGIGTQLVTLGSDSQDLNRTMETMVHGFGMTLMEAVEILFPPIISEIKLLAPPLQDLYMFFRQLWGPFSQGPAGIVTRNGDECVFGVDAMGLRPLWYGETEKEYFFSSEKGVIPIDVMISDPLPLAPGERIAVQVERGHRVRVLRHPEIQKRVNDLARHRWPGIRGYRQHLEGPVSTRATREHERYYREYLADDQSAAPDHERLLAAFGWDREDVDAVERLAGTGNEKIGSLGWDGPLAALNDQRQNLADYFKETVAVVTNPAIDREREIEHFSLRMVLGRRPQMKTGKQVRPHKRMELTHPILLGGHLKEQVIPPEVYRNMAENLGTSVLEDLLAEFAEDPGAVKIIAASYRPEEGLRRAVQRVAEEAVSAARNDGAHVILVDDGTAFRHGRHAIDPHLALSWIDLALNRELDEHGESFRRRVSLVLRSGALRNLHDMAMAVAVGADAVNPYLVLDGAMHAENWKALENLVIALRKGFEKVISTMGIHELRGYGRFQSSIGLEPELAGYLRMRNFYGSEGRGLSLADLERDAGERYRIATGQPDEPAGDGAPARKAPLGKTFHFNPFVYKLAQRVAETGEGYEDFAAKVKAQELEHPVSLRHVLDFHTQPNAEGTRLFGLEVDCSVGEHSLPLLISSMSFGSQGETAYRAYAEAAKKLNMICVNGEGGELPDMIGMYPKWRGQQIASGRFGVTAELLNSSYLLEIKIGQGAKPGEGGHLPGSKVTARVALARNAAPGVDLISPSNNHDLYSIEDLAQLIEELKTGNPMAKVAVKLPCVPGIGTIAVGVAKAGADIVTLSGFDGGTGAARAHALRHVGLPVEIGVREAHLALQSSGLREKVEVWADGGVKGGADVVKLILLGANRCGFGTMSMVAIGCTICRGCQLDTCHVGIATQVTTQEEADHKGMKRFVPREYDRAVHNLVNYFSAVGEEIRGITAALGAMRTQDLVGRCDLLHQPRLKDQVDLTELITVTAEDYAIEDYCAPMGPMRRPLNHLTKVITGMAMEQLDRGQTAVMYEDDKVTSMDRALGTHLSGEITRRRYAHTLNGVATDLVFHEGTIPGNGLAAFNVKGVTVKVEGGAQDGVGKSSLGGKVSILKGMNWQGGRVDGSVGKSLLYGAQGGTFYIQGDADSRACIRLSGADVVLGGRLRGHVDDESGNMAGKANLKGFAFEYMTLGRAVVLGDPGPWMCSGMTGGVVYVRLQPELGMDLAALDRRKAKAAMVEIVDRLDTVDEGNLAELLGGYADALEEGNQPEEAREVRELAVAPHGQFAKIVARNQQVDPAVSTE